LILDRTPNSTDDEPAANSTTSAAARFLYIFQSAIHSFNSSPTYRGWDVFPYFPFFLIIIIISVPVQEDIIQQKERTLYWKHNTVSERRDITASP
jgi:hypothetical protein